MSCGCHLVFGIQASFSSEAEGPFIVLFPGNVLEVFRARNAASSPKGEYIRGFPSNGKEERALILPVRESRELYPSADWKFINLSKSCNSSHHFSLAGTRIAVGTD